MTTAKRTARYGVRVENEAVDDLDECAESLAATRLRGSRQRPDRQGRSRRLRERFGALHRHLQIPLRGGGDWRRSAKSISFAAHWPRSPSFLQLACNLRVLALCERLIGPGFILGQQNGIVNPAGAKQFSQSAFHRDLPYQHFVSSRPLALNALFCLDAFTVDNGATMVIPASHKQEAFPSERVLAAHTKQIAAPAGSFLVLDCMTYHCGGSNRTAQDRRAVNHVYSIALMRQQIDLPAPISAPTSRPTTAARQLCWGTAIRCRDPSMTSSASDLASRKA